MTSTPPDARGAEAPWDAVLTPLRAQDPREIGGYLLRARVGAGGMGTVFLSYTPGGRPLAVKQAHAEFAADLEFRRRFAREVEIAARVQGLYTAPVVNADASAELPWLATAYVAAPSLGVAVARHGPLPPESAVVLIAGVAEALQSIHAAGVIHRDLKPGNIVLAADGPRVIDFGISRAMEGSSTSRTHPGVLFGTPAFMPPERVRGDDLGPTGDVFALGVTAYYAVTGELPFGNDAAVFYRILHESPNWGRCPDQVREILVRCVDKDPTRRPRPEELIDLCRVASTDDRLRIGEGWLPATIVGEITRYQLAPLADPTPADVPPRAADETSHGRGRTPGGGTPGGGTPGGGEPASDEPRAEPRATGQRPVWVPWMLGGLGVLALLLAGLVPVLRDDSAGKPSGTSARDAPAVLASGGVRPSAAVPGESPLIPGDPSAAAESSPLPGAGEGSGTGTGPAHNELPGSGPVLSSVQVRLEEDAYSRDSLDLDAVPPVVTGQSESLRVEHGDLAGNRLATWTGPAAPTAQDCVEVLRLRPVDRIALRAGSWFCAVGWAVPRVVAGNVGEYDGNVSLIRLTMWDSRFEA